MMEQNVDSLSEPSVVAQSRKAGSRAPYGPRELVCGLLAVALSSGNARRGARLLEARGLPVSWSTLYRWRGKHAPLYEFIDTHLTPKAFDGLIAPSSPSRSHK